MNMTFGEKLKELRESKGWTKKQLAELSGISQQAIVHWEQGDRVPGLDAVFALCDAFGVRLAEFEDCDVTPKGRKHARGPQKKK